MPVSESTSEQLSGGQTMYALRAHERGGPEQLVYERAPQPAIGLGDALVRVHAASFTPTEMAWPPTWEDRAGRERRPTIPAHEVAGTVAALGYGTTGPEVGAPVYALTDWYRDGAAAEYIAVEVRDLAPMPTTLSFVEAAAVPLAGLTAWQALFDYGALSAGQTVLIHGGGGGVGIFAIQLAHSAGARVIATGRKWAQRLVTELGADEFIDLEQQPFEEAAGAVDLALDLIGGDILKRTWSVIRPGGALVSVVADPVDMAPESLQARGAFFIVTPNRDQLIELARRIDAGALRPIVGAVRPLPDGRAAFEAKLTGGIPGKVALAVVE
jgi:NADPH:quinone reductase-like Zn-dependent oxidoreductase